MSHVKFFAAALSVAAVFVYFAWAGHESGAVTKPTAEAQTKAIVTATTAFLDSLSADQRAKVTFPFKPQKAAVIARFFRSGKGVVPAPEGYVVPKDTGGPPPAGVPGQPGQGPVGGFTGERYGDAVWSNFPVSDVLRPGLRMGSLTDAQREAAMHVLQTALSAKGYEKMQEIMGADQVMADQGQNYDSGKAVYTIGVFGTPSTTEPWMLEFGGHHIGLNIVIAGKQGVMTPTLTGAQPSVYKADGKDVRVLAGENDKAFALLNALDETQRKQAILNYTISDFIQGPGNGGVTILPEGIKGSALNVHQKEMLLSIIEEWAGIINDAYAAPRVAEIKAGLNDTYFAWSGPTTHDPGMNGRSYYRIQGPKVVIEFSPQNTAGDSELHVHTVYRDPTNDYGVKFTGAQ